MKAERYLLLLLLFFSCAGNHGMLQRYKFDVGETELKAAISSVINANGNITEDSINRQYNDGKSYITIFIQAGADKYGYVLRYYDSGNMPLDKSEIFVAFSRINGKGGKDGDPELTEDRKQKLLKVLEDELMSPVAERLKKIT